jgi:hypothetical protein
VGGVDVAEVGRRTGVVWVAAGGRPAVAAWQLWRDGASHLLTGPGEQPLGELRGAASCTVTARSEDGATTWPATVEELVGDERAEVLPALLAARLNGSPDPATAVVLRLRPTPAG